MEDIKGGGNGLLFCFSLKSPCYPHKFLVGTDFRGAV